MKFNYFNKIKFIRLVTNHKTSNIYCNQNMFLWFLRSHPFPMLLKSQIEFQIPVDHRQIQLALCKTIDIIFLSFVHL